MKLLPALLAVSLLANAAWLITRVTREPSASGPADTVARAATTTGSTQAASSRNDASSSANVVVALKANNVESLRTLLRDAGVPEDTVRRIVSSAIWSRYHDRIKALQPKPDPNKPWWKNEPGWYGNNMSREDRAELRRLQREASDEVTRVLGPDPSQGSGNPWMDARLAFLPEAKRKDFQEIEQDYQDLIQEAQQEMQGFSLPSDAEKIRYLQEEKKRDLAAILTPQELADYDLRMSPTAQQLRWKMSRFEGSEDEYRKIFALQQSFDATHQIDAWGNPIGRSPEDWQKRNEATKQLNAQIKEALGAERYGDYIRAQHHEYQQLAAATKRLALPPETATRIFNLRHDISAESLRIADNATFTSEQKHQQIAALVEKTRDQVRTALGAEAGEVYLKGGMNWLSNFEKGYLVTFSEDGNQNGGRHLPREPKDLTKSGP